MSNSKNPNLFDKIVSWCERVLIPVAAKFGSQRHLVAIRDGFATTLPLILAGAFAVLINSLFFSTSSLLAYAVGEDSAFIVWTSTNIAPFFGIIWSGTFAIFALAVVAAISYASSISLKIDPLAAILISSGVFFLMGGGNNLDARGIFIGFFVALITPEILSFVFKKGWTIKLPSQVPPAVGKAFAAIIPAVIAMIPFALVAYAIQLAQLEFSINQIDDAGDRVTVIVIAENIFDLFEYTIASGLKSLGTSLPVIMFLRFTSAFLWFFGLHGENLIGPINQVLYAQSTLENVQIFADTGIRDWSAGYHIWVSTSQEIYTQFGGSGSTLGLIIAIFIFSKVKTEREIAKLALPSGVFEINEPVIFGIPIVLNPIYFIPFVIIAPIQAAIAYGLSASGFAGPVIVNIPWMTPPILNSFLATQSWGAVVTQIICAAVAIGIYIPFVILSNVYEKNKSLEKAALDSEKETVKS